jgi:hypothetical protein
MGLIQKGVAAIWKYRNKGCNANVNTNLTVRIKEVLLNNETLSRTLFNVSSLEVHVHLSTEYCWGRWLHYV